MGCKGGGLATVGVPVGHSKEVWICCHWRVGPAAYCSCMWPGHGVAEQRRREVCCTKRFFWFPSATSQYFVPLRVP